MLLVGFGCSVSPLLALELEQDVDIISAAVEKLQWAAMGC